MSRADSRGGIVLGDVLLTLSVLALAAALAYPRIRNGAFAQQLEQVSGQVEAVIDATERFRTEADRWPDPTPPGRTPDELAAYLPAGFSFDQVGYQLDLDVWETAAEAPPIEVPIPNTVGGEPTEIPDTTATPPAALFGSLAGVTVRSQQAALLAGLLDRFGSQRSFVVGDAWTLVFASVPGR